MQCRISNNNINPGDCDGVLLFSSEQWVIQEKIHTPTTEGMLENLTGGEVNGSGNPDSRGALNLKIHPRG